MPSSKSKIAEPDCPFFGPDRERYFTDALRANPACRRSAA